MLKKALDITEWRIHSTEHNLNCIQIPKVKNCWYPHDLEKIDYAQGIFYLLATT